jgi:uncharacterized protein (TIGR02246 family)
MGLGSKAASTLGIVMCFPFFATSLAADSKSNLDTINQQTVAGADDPEKAIYEEVVKACDAWNRHDLDGYLDTFWRSDALVVVVEGETVHGWTLLSKAFHVGYPNPLEMGELTLDRVRVQMLGEDLAEVLTWDTVTFPKKKEFGTSTIVMKKLPEGWRVMLMHTSFVEP